jgi:large subunit ribosomal protein L25
MADIQILAAEIRDRAGKGTARAARRAGRIPAIIYGNKESPLPVTLEAKVVSKAIESPGFYTSLIDLEVEGVKHRVLPRDTQFHPVTSVPLHIDFLRFDPNRRITVEVPVAFVNEREAPGIVRGGLINVVRHAVEVNCSASNIPDQFEVDLTGLDIGDSVHAQAVLLPEGVEFTITDRDFTIATIAAPTVMPSSDQDSEDSGDTPTGSGEGSSEDEAAD